MGACVRGYIKNIGNEATNLTVDGNTASGKAFFIPFSYRTIFCAGTYSNDYTNLFGLLATEDTEIPIERESEVTFVYNGSTQTAYVEDVIDNPVNGERLLALALGIYSFTIWN